MGLIIKKTKENIMSSQLNPYLTFVGKARSVMDFYSTIFGGELTLQTFKEMHAAQSPEQEELIMHGQLITNDGMTLMASDDPESENESKNVSIAVTGDNEAKLSEYFNKLSEGGMTIVPMSKQAWGDMFGMCTDKFGVRWLINVTKPKA
jgi:PhnB protein